MIPPDPYEELESILDRNGIECGDISILPGWIPLVKDLVALLLTLGWSGEIHQIKQKFGGLRFYASDLDENESALVDAAEKLSFATCEGCGKTGKRRSIKGWIVTRCEGCGP